MNPQSRLSRPLDPATPRRSGRLNEGDEGEASQELPSLANILARYREHGTLARSVAVWDPTQSQSLPGAMPVSRLAAVWTQGPRPFKEVIEGLQTRELDGSELFEQFFGAEAPKPPASR